MGTTEVKTVTVPRTGFTSEASRAGDVFAQNPRSVALAQERDSGWAVSSHLRLPVGTPEKRRGTSQLPAQPINTVDP